MKHDLEEDLLSNQTIVDKCKNSKIYSQNLYATLCNNRFFYGDEEWNCSWRFAGGLVADIRSCGEEYTDYYCSGMTVNSHGYVSESFVTDEIRLDLLKLGWIVKPYEK